MPVGNASRLDLVLRAGEARRQLTVPLGDILKYKGVDAANALAVKPSVSTTPKKKPGTPPAVKVPAGINDKKATPVRKDTGDDMNDDSSLWLNDLVVAYKTESEARKTDLDRVRKAAKECTENRVTEITKSLKDQEDSAERIINALKGRLQAVSTELAKLQTSSEDNTSQKDACEDARRSVQRNLDALKVSSNTERDDARRIAANTLQEKEAELNAELLKYKASATKEAAEAAKELRKCLDEKEQLLKDNATENASITQLKREKREEMEKFQKAAQAACKALGEYA